MSYDEEITKENQDKILRILSLHNHSKKLVRIHLFLSENKVNFPYEWFWNPKVVESLQKMEVILRREIPKAENIEMIDLLRNRPKSNEDLQDFLRMKSLMARYIEVLHSEVESIERMRNRPKRIEMTKKFQRQKAAEITTILAEMDAILKRHMAEYISVLVPDKRTLADTIRSSSSYMAERTWTDLIGYVSMPILGSDIAGFKEWLFLNGYKDPNLSHDGFDFSCYLDIKGRVVIGLPKLTPVRAVFDGKVVELLYWPYDVKNYKSDMSISHSRNPRKLVSLYAHIVPAVKRGQFVRKGQIIGFTHADKGNDKGYLCHLSA